MRIYIVIKLFTGALDTSAVGVTADLEDGSAAILKEKEIIAHEGSESHLASGAKVGAALQNRAGTPTAAPNLQPVLDAIAAQPVAEDVGPQQ
jgi:hypothetical protein